MLTMPSPTQESLGLGRQQRERRNFRHWAGTRRHTGGYEWAHFYAYPNCPCNWPYTHTHTQESLEPAKTRGRNSGLQYRFGRNWPYAHHKMWTRLSSKLCTLVARAGNTRRLSSSKIHPLSSILLAIATASPGKVYRFCEVHGVHTENYFTDARHTLHSVMK